MKTMKTYLLSALLVVGSGVLAYAADETARAVGFQQSILGVVHTTSGTSRTGESRRLDTDQVGAMKIIDGMSEVIDSTGGPVGLLGGGRADNLVGSSVSFNVGNTTNSFTVPISSFIGNVGCRNFGDNCNLARIASVASPVFVKRLIVGDVVGNGGITPGRTRIRMFDTQGSTGTNPAPLNRFLNVAVASGTVIEVGHWCSSGTVIMKDSPADIQVILGKQNR